MKNEKGFTHYAVLLILILLVGGIGVLAFSRVKKQENKLLQKSPMGGPAQSPKAGGLEYEPGIRLQPSLFGVQAGLPVADVSAIKLDNGNWRIYAFAQKKGIVSATSKDGLEFTAEAGARLGDGAGMPRVMQLEDGRLRLYFIDGGGVGSAISSDGLTFTKEAGKRILAPAGVKDISGISTPVKLKDGKWHVYFSDLPRPGDGVKPHYIYSATSSDLMNWTLDDGYRIGGGKVATSGEHPDVRLADDGTLVLYYFINDTKKLVTSTSTDGLTFSDYKETGLDCNDPNLVKLDARNYRIYCGDFDNEIGGYVKSAKFSL